MWLIRITGRLLRPSRIMAAALAVLLACGDSSRAQTHSQRLVIQNFYYALPGKAQEVYELRLRASEVRGALGLPRGRVLRRMPDQTEKSLPDVEWECEYLSVAAREKDVAALEHSEEFTRIEKKMDSLLREFERAAFSE
jgi:hypothetical protein